jgi:hypothetical protein
MLNRRPLEMTTEVQAELPALQVKHHLV